MSEVAKPRAVTPERIERLAWADVRALVALTLVASWLGYFLFTRMPALTLEVFPATLTLHLVIGGAALVYVVYLAAARRLPGGTPIDWAVLGVIIAYILATVASVNWRISLDATLQLGVAMIAFYVLSGLPFVDATHLRYALMVVGGALAIYALWIVGNDYADYVSLTRRIEGLSTSNIFPPTVPRLHSVSDHPNIFAMIMTLIMPFFALSAYRSGTGWERAGGVAGLLAGGIAVFLTLSRGGWLGTSAAVVITVAGAWLTARIFDEERAGRAITVRALVPRGLTPTALATIGGAIVLVAGGALAFLARSSARPGWLFRSSLSPRQDAWHAGWDMFRDHPLLGTGPDGFGILYPEYSGKFLVHTQHAHNGFLQLADDAGVVGILAVGVLVAATGYVLFRIWRRGSLDQRLVSVTCAAGLTGFALHNQVDAGNIWKAPGVALAIVGAIIVRTYLELPPRAIDDPVRRPLKELRWLSYTPLVPRVALLLLLFVPFAAWWRIDSAHYDYWRAIQRFNNREAGAVESMQDAVDRDSSMMVNRLQLGQMQATVYQGSVEKDPALIGAAVVNLEQAVKLDKRSDLAHANLARAYALAGRDDDAAAEAGKTRVISSHHVPPVLMAGELYEDIGRDTDAIETYGQALSMDAGIADSGYWQMTAFRRDHFQEILGRSVLGINPCVFGAYLVQAHRTDPRAPLDRLGESSTGCQLVVFSAPTDLAARVAYAKILIEQGRLQDAFVHLDYAVKRQPDYGPARTELGRWYARTANNDDARHQWVVGSQLDEAESVLELGKSYPPGEVPGDVVDKLGELLPTSGSTIRNDLISVLYYRMRYGRVSPLSALIPGDWEQAVPRVYAEMQRALAEWGGTP